MLFCRHRSRPTIGLSMTRAPVNRRGRLPRARRLRSPPLRWRELPSDIAGHPPRWRCARLWQQRRAHHRRGLAGWRDAFFPVARTFAGLKKSSGCRTGRPSSRWRARAMDGSTSRSPTAARACRSARARREGMGRGPELPPALRRAGGDGAKLSRLGCRDRAGPMDVQEPVGDWREARRILWLGRPLPHS